MSAQPAYTAAQLVSELETLAEMVCLLGSDTVDPGTEASFALVERRCGNGVSNAVRRAYAVIGAHRTANAAGLTGESDVERARRLAR